MKIMVSMLKNDRVEALLTQRMATVIAITDLSPTLRRIRLQGSDLEGFCFETLSPETHVKLFFPCDSKETITLPEVLNAGRSADWSGAREGRFSPFRDYTIRAFDAEALTIDIDFVLHDVGVGGPWAKQAEIGQCLGVFGPRSFKFPPLDAEHYVLLADETSLPALARWLEILPASARIDAWVEVASIESQIPLPEHDNAKVRWVYSDAGYGQGLIDAVNAFSNDLISESTWVWGATEAHTVAQLKRHFLAHTEVAVAHLDMVSYWKQA